MTSITILTIIVTAFLTAIVFALTWLAYSSHIRVYQLEVEQGKHDYEIQKNYDKNKKPKGKWFRSCCSYAFILVIFTLFIIGMIHKLDNRNLSIGNKTVLVIKSDSMSKFYNDDVAVRYNYDTSLHFDIGDVCVFEISEFELVENEVYGYMYNDIIITHRLVEYNQEEGMCRFKGDNNNGFDRQVAAEDVIYHYTGVKIPVLGAFILYAQSHFGIWAFVGVVIVAISSEFAFRKVEKINRERNKKINEDDNHEK